STATRLRTSRGASLSNGTSMTSPRVVPPSLRIRRLPLAAAKDVSPSSRCHGPIATAVRPRSADQSMSAPPSSIRVSDHVHSSTHLMLTILRQAECMSEWCSERIVIAPRVDSRRHREIHDALGQAAFEQLLDRFFHEAEQLLATLRIAETADQTTR